MKSTIELQILEYENGKPCIAIRHHDKSTELNDKLLGLLINGLKTCKIVLKNPSGYIDTMGNSWENYQITFEDGK